jgi:hypothetical protein
MRVFRVFLLLFMSVIVLLMAGCPGLYDSKRREIAHRHYTAAPSDSTLKELDEAKRLDSRDILVFELVMAGVLALSVIGFDRAGKCDSKNAA